MYLINVAIMLMVVYISNVLYQCCVYGNHVSALLHCISVLQKCCVFLLHYITAFALLALSFCLFLCNFFFGWSRLQNHFLIIL